MRRPGSNLPDFRATQLAFAANIRNPELNPVPEGIDARRMKVYQDLFFNNIESFLAGSFPVAKKILGSGWEALVREFVHRHPSETPYFLEISQEFLTFLDQRGLAGLPQFLLELCHYEWVELALGVNDAELPTGFDPGGDLLNSALVISPFIWCLAYQWPVHEIGPEHLPQTKPDRTTELIVYRRLDDRVRFMVVNPVTHRLLEILRTGVTGQRALDTMASELEGVDSSVVYERGIATLQRLRDAQIILGTLESSDSSE